jgi:hypothetical protein
VSVVARGRRAAEALLVDTGVMRRPTGRSAQNADGEEESEFEDVFTSPCKIQGPSSSSRDTGSRTVTVGGVERPVIEGGLHIPVGKPATERGWVFEVTSVGALSDIRLLGKKYMVDNDPVKSNATARRIDVVEV